MRGKKRKERVTETARLCDKRSIRERRLCAVPFSPYVALCLWARGMNPSESSLCLLDPSPCVACIQSSLHLRALAPSSPVCPCAERGERQTLCESTLSLHSTDQPNKAAVLGPVFQVMRRNCFINDSAAIHASAFFFSPRGRICESNFERVMGT